MIEILANVGIGILAGIVRGGVGFVKNSQTAQEKFDISKYLVTLGLYGIIGGGCALLGVQLDIGVSIAMTMGIGVFIQELAKTFATTGLYKALAAKVGSLTA